MKPQLLIFFLLFVSVWTHESRDDSLTKLLSDFLAREEFDSRAPHKRILQDNNFNVDDFGNSSDIDTESDDYIPIMTLDYFGTWNATVNMTTPQFGFFNNTFGSAEFTASENNSIGIDNNLVFRFYDGQYTDQKAVIINFEYDNNTDFDPATSTFQNSSMTFSIYKYDDGSDSGDEIFCEGSYKLAFIDSKTNGPYQKMSNDYESVFAQFWLNSTNCSISIFSTVSTDSSIKQSQAMDYAIMIVIICVAHLYACIKMSRDIIMNEPSGNRISLITLGFFGGWDVFLCLFHLYNALTIDDFFPSFVIPAFCYFILVSIFETRLILLVWKARYYNQLVATNDLRRGLMVFYLKFYGFLSGFLLICYFVVPATWFFYVTSFFFLPQIIHNAMRGQRYKFNATYTLLLGVVRIALPLYVKLCPVSIFKLTPEPIFGYVYGSIILFQVAILMLQSKIGTRFFIPSSFLPAKYNYYVSIKNAFPDEEVESCPICMDPLNQHPSNVKSSLIAKSSKNLKIMQTPCRHHFHEPCLKDWMDVKLECPFCRSTLPPLE